MTDNIEQRLQQLEQKVPHLLSAGLKVRAVLQMQDTMFTALLQCLDLSPPQKAYLAQAIDLQMQSLRKADREGIPGTDLGSLEHVFLDHAVAQLNGYRRAIEKP